MVGILFVVYLVCLFVFEVVLCGVLVVEFNVELIDVIDSFGFYFWGFVGEWFLKVLGLYLDENI